MVLPSLAIGGAVGVLLSGGFIWWEVGRFATPQVPVTLFDERKLLAAYTVGLFAGVPLAAAYLLFTVALGNGALIGGAIFLAALVGGTELAQVLSLRTRYWSGPPGPFYAVALRAGIGGIIALAVLSAALSAPSLSWEGLAPASVNSIAAVALQVTGGLVAFGPLRAGIRTRARPLEGALFGAVGFFLIGFGPLAGVYGAIGGGLIALLGAMLVYRRQRVTFEEVPPPTGRAVPGAPTLPSAYGRTPAPAAEPPTPEPPLK